MKNNPNAGFSLIELVVVIAVMIILAVGGMTLFLNGGGTKSKTSASNIASYLDSAQNYCMTKKASYMTIEYKDDAYWVSNSEGEEKRLPSGITIAYQTNNTESGKTEAIDETNPTLMLGFDRTTGGFKPLVYLTNETDKDGKVTGQKINYKDGEYCKRIFVSVGGSYERTIKLYTKTGKHEIVVGHDNFNVPTKVVE